MSALPSLRRIAFAKILLSLLVLLSGSLFAGMREAPQQRAVLSGVHNFSLGLCSSGLSQSTCDQARARAERILERAGIKLVDDAHAELGLELTIESASKGGFQMFHWELSAFGAMPIKRAGQDRVVAAKLWWVGSFGATETNPDDFLLHRVDEISEALAKDYVAAQAKP